MNKSILSGVVLCTPEIKSANSGDYCQLSLSNEVNFTNPQGEAKSFSQNTFVLCWGNVLPKIKNLSVGTKVYVEGTMLEENVSNEFPLPARPYLLANIIHSIPENL